MFRLLAAATADERMTELERFIEFWYGPRCLKYGEPDVLTQYPDLPAALRRFYAFAGRWPVPGGEAGDEDTFFGGSGGHHLLSLDQATATPNGRVRFFMEYQGDWDGVTLTRGTTRRSGSRGTGMMTGGVKTTKGRSGSR